MVNFEPVTGEVFYPSKEELMKHYRVIVTTLITAGRWGLDLADHSVLCSGRWKERGFDRHTGTDKRFISQDPMGG